MVATLLPGVTGTASRDVRQAVHARQKRGLWTCPLVVPFRFVRRPTSFSFAVIEVVLQVQTRTAFRRQACLFITPLPPTSGGTCHTKTTFLTVVSFTCPTFSSCMPVTVTGIVSTTGRLTLNVSEMSLWIKPFSIFMRTSKTTNIAINTILCPPPSTTLRRPNDTLGAIVWGGTGFMRPELTTLDATRPCR